MSRPSVLLPLGRLSLPSLGGQQASFNFFITQCPYRAALINRPSAVNETVVCGVAPTKPQTSPYFAAGCQWWTQLCGESTVHSARIRWRSGDAARVAGGCLYLILLAVTLRRPCGAERTVDNSRDSWGGPGSAGRYITSPGGLRDASHKQTFSQQVRRANFHLDVKQTREVDASSEAGTGLNSSGLLLV